MNYTKDIIRDINAMHEAVENMRGFSVRDMRITYYWYAGVGTWREVAA